MYGMTYAFNVLESNNTFKWAAVEIQKTGWRLSFLENLHNRLIKLCYTLEVEYLNDANTNCLPDGQPDILACLNMYIEEEMSKTLSVQEMIYVVTSICPLFH